MNQNEENIPEFIGGNVPINVAARVMKKDASIIRQAMQEKLIDIGFCIMMPGKVTYTYYISPKKFWEYTGYIYRGEKE